MTTIPITYECDNNITTSITTFMIPISTENHVLSPLCSIYTKAYNDAKIMLDELKNSDGEFVYRKRIVPIDILKYKNITVPRRALLEYYVICNAQHFISAYEFECEEVMRLQLQGELAKQMRKVVCDLEWYAREFYNSKFELSNFNTRYCMYLFKKQR